MNKMRALEYCLWFVIGLTLVRKEKKIRRKERDDGEKV